MQLAELLFEKNKCFVADSDFCVLHGLILLCQKAVFGSALVKKHKYWPEGVDGDQIARDFADKEKGYANAKRGTLDDIPFHLFCMTEEDYIMTLMSTYGTLERMGNSCNCDYMEGNEKCHKSFMYSEVIQNHFQYWESVDANNKNRMDPIALDEVWKMHCWPCWVFQFILAVMEVNTWLAALTIYGKDALTVIDFHRKLAKEMINNEYDSRSMDAIPALRPHLTLHEFVTPTPGLQIDPKTGAIIPRKMAYLMRKCKKLWSQKMCYFLFL